VTYLSRWVWLAGILGSLSPFVSIAQIDPVRRDLIQVGYNAALQGHPPQSGYAYYYGNRPNFVLTNLTLRLAVAPTYLDSELGIKSCLGENTDVGIGLAGGGYADNYPEIRQGRYLPEESFLGYGGELSVSVYHLVNPAQQIPLNVVIRGTGHFTLYERDARTDNDFELPDDHGRFSLRTGIRFGGREPTLFPSLAMELSIWYQGEYRTEHGPYGFSGDRKLNEQSHLFWGQALLAYELPELKHDFFLSFIAGTSIDADRFSGYRLGALLPLVSEFPLSLPGYYYQEISAKNFLLIGGNYLMPIDNKQRWNFDVAVATAGVGYLPGLEQHGNWHTGVGGGILYKTPTFKVMVGYAYGVDAIRSNGRGAHSIGVLMQLDLGQAKESMFNPSQPGLWRGLQHILGLF
jgi:hypothetical protein